VFEEVRQTTLVFLFLHGTNLLRDVEIGLTRSSKVLANIVG
jgi:hypothetical protein